jgi:hypothetical protein
VTWASPRCSTACWAEIRAHDAAHRKLVDRALEIARDRDEWKQQHENLLAMYRASEADRSSRIARAEAMAKALEKFIREHDSVYEGQSPFIGEPFCGDCNMGAGPHKEYCAYHDAQHALAAYRSET